MTAIDVLLPYWGDVGYFIQAVRSVLAQTMDDWRLVILDDGYPDPEPARWIAELADPRIEYHRNAENLGANANYRAALAMASAPLLVMMGADDVMRPNYLAVILAAADRHPEAAVIQPGVEVIDSAGTGVPAAGRPGEALVRPDLAPLGAWGRRANADRTGAGPQPVAGRLGLLPFAGLAHRCRPANRLPAGPACRVQDLALLLDIAAEGGSLLVDGTLAFGYRRHPGSDSSVKAVQGSRFDEERRYFYGQADRFSAQGWTKAARAAGWHFSSGCTRSLCCRPRCGSVTALPGACCATPSADGTGARPGRSRRPGRWPRLAPAPRSWPSAGPLPPDSRRTRSSERDISQAKCRQTPSSNTKVAAKSRLVGTWIPASAVARKSTSGNSTSTRITTPITSHSTAYFSRSWWRRINTMMNAMKPATIRPPIKLPVPIGGLLILVTAGGQGQQHNQDRPNQEQR